MDGKIKELKDEIEKYEGKIGELTEKVENGSELTNVELIEARAEKRRLGKEKFELELEGDVSKERKRQFMKEMNDEIDRGMEKWETESKKRAAERGAGSPESAMKKIKIMSVEEKLKDDWKEVAVTISLLDGENEKGPKLLKVCCESLKLDFSIFGRSCYCTYREKFGDFDNMIWMTGTPGTGKTTLLKYLFFEEAKFQRNALFYFDETVWITREGKMKIIDEMDEECFKGLCDLLKDKKPMILMDCPKDEDDAVARVKNARQIGMSQRVIVASSPKERINDDLIDDWIKVDESKGGTPLRVCFMKLWSDEEFRQLISETDSCKFNKDYEEDVVMFGKIPRLLFEGSSEYEKSMEKHCTDKRDLETIITRFKKVLERRKGDDRTPKVGFMSVPHHLFLIDFEDISLFPKVPYVPFTATDYVWRSLIDYLEELNTEESFLSLISLAMDLGSGTAFETLAFKYLAALKDKIDATELLSENELKSGTSPTMLSIGPFSKLVKFCNVEEFKRIAEDLKDEVVTSTVKNWYTVDGFCKDGWLQMTVSSTHRISLTAAESTKLLGFPGQMEVMEKTDMNSGNFIFVVPKDVEFEKQKIGKRVSDKNKEMKELKKNEKENAEKIKTLQTQLNEDKAERELNTAMKKKLKQFVLKLSEDDFQMMKDNMYNRA